MIGMVVHNLNPSFLSGGDSWVSEFEASLLYRVSSRTARLQNESLFQRKQKTTKAKTVLLYSSKPA